MVAVEEPKQRPVQRRRAPGLICLHGQPEHGAHALELRPERGLGGRPHPGRGRRPPDRREVRRELRGSPAEHERVKRRD
jgi:hypothetical protein